MASRATWVRLDGSSGCYVLTDEAGAEGVAAGGKVYHLLGRRRMLGTEPEAVVEEVDGGEAVGAMQDWLGQMQADVDETVLDYEYRLALLELGLDNTTV